MLVRISGRPVWDTIYGEDNGIYLPGALAHPWHLLAPYAGYLQLVPRLIGQIAAAVPIRSASAVFAVAGAVIASACGLFAYHASAGYVTSRWLRALIGLSVLLLPVAQLEIADTGVNSTWYLLAALFWAALWRPRSRGARSVAALVGFAAAASSSLALLFAPLFAARLIAVPRRFREHAVSVGWALGSVLQVLVMATSHQPRGSHPNLEYGLVYVAREVIWPALGWHLAWHVRAAVGGTNSTLIVGAFLAVVLGALAVTQSSRCRVFMSAAVATGLLFTLVPTTISFVPGEPVNVAHEPGARYSTVPILLLDAAIIVAADACARRWRPRPLALAAAAALVAVLAVGWVADFRYPVLDRPDWARTASAWLRHCQYDPDGPITVHSSAWYGPSHVSTFKCASLRR
jgi:hypothetical protein